MENESLIFANHINTEFKRLFKESEFKAINFLCNEIMDKLYDEEIELINNCFEFLDLENFPNEYLLGVLTFTNMFKQFLSNRPQLIERVKSILIKREIELDRIDRLLKGLY